MSVEFITADFLSGAKHGFFTRKGGASSGVFEGLNCGSGSSDQSEAVAINRARVCESLGATADDLATVYQIHSPVAVEASAPFKDRPEADAMVSATPGVVLGILTADCLPVLFHDPESGVVGAAHAGWKGALGGVLEATIDAMEALGASRGLTQAAIGPCISQSNYEVGPEFFERFEDEDPENARFFAGGTGDRMHFDLPSYALDRLRRAGIGNVEWTRHCTYADEDRFFSYRRSVHRREADYGRLISAIRV